MYIEIMDGFGKDVRRIPVSQVVVYDDVGNPLAVAAKYGPEGGHYVGHVVDPEFNRVLQSLGIERYVICDELQIDPPPGARLIHKPEGAR